MWVQRSIKEPAYLEDQAKIFEEWIHTARECRAMKNFSSAHAIITALMSRKIAMLVLACESQATEVLDTLNRDLMPTDAYHETLRQVETKELIPLLGRPPPLHPQFYLCPL
ncbi:hypothetical protein F5148DRAFT_585940 [Russula earlei]|uniref:Uncharacterized protein n=1 Tax=Russula earlei TaxID=71964 RepID=A0ACC0TW96_9AGAM|nr:hypothetical protein F5148DRAFT_585940 [Russula earlei]